MLQVPRDRLLEHANELKDKVVLITGSGGGFGLSTALLASQHGAKIIIADVKTQLVTDALAKLRSAGGICSAPLGLVDVTDPQALRDAFQHSSDEYGRYPDVVIANAGVAADDYFEEDGEIADGQPAQVRAPRNITLAVNLNGVLNTCVVARECWKQQPSVTDRRLVVLSSMGGITGIPAASAYAASKHAVMAYWQSTCQELARGEAEGFQFDVICPFFAKTAIFDPKTLLVLAGIPLIELNLVAKSMVYSISRTASTSAGYAVILADNGDPMLVSADEYDPLSPEWTRLTNEGRTQYNDWVKVSAWKRVYRDVARNYFKTSEVGLALRIVATVAILFIAARYTSQLVKVVPAWVPIAAGTAFGLSGRLGDVRRKSDIMRAKNKAAFKAKQRAAAQKALAEDKTAN